MKQFTTITKDGSRWLRPINVPYPNADDYEDGEEPNFAFARADAIIYEEMTRPVPYIGSRPDGTTLDESEVREVRQFMIGGTIDWDNTITEHGDWITLHDIDKDRIEAGLPDFLKRTVYTDAEPPDTDYEKEMPHKQWPSTKYVARKMDNGWTHISDALPEHMETVWLSNGKGFTTLGCLVWTEDGWHWAATNGVIYEENGRIVSECESDDIDAEYWHRLPDALRIDKEDLI